jgi:shikimate dehydrogenase
MAMIDSISATTRICAVYGHPIKHSASPAMQNAGIAALGLNWRYVAFDVHPDNLREAIAGAKAMRFIGLNLTVPHKLLALQMVDVIDEAARPWGAINTIRFEGRDGSNWRPLAELPPDLETEIRSVGFNTDADAIIKALDIAFQLPLAGKKVLIIGAGGAGRTASLRIAREQPGELWLVNRTTAKAQQVADEIAKDFPKVTVRVGYPRRRIDLLINATSVGLKANDPLPFDETQFELQWAENVFDMIYSPETKLIQNAKVQCRNADNGLWMLLCQGAAALELWSEQKAPFEEMRKALSRHIYGHV